jgi:hypothetical protein
MGEFYMPDGERSGVALRLTFEPRLSLRLSRFAPRDAHRHAGLPLPETAVPKTDSLEVQASSGVPAHVPGAAVGFAR